MYDKKAVICTASHTRICFSTTSHMRYCKSLTLCLNKIEGSYDKIIITIVPSYTGKKITTLLPLALLLVLCTQQYRRQQTC